MNRNSGGIRNCAMSGTGASGMRPHIRQWKCSNAITALRAAFLKKMYLPAVLLSAGMQ